jgi:metal transporter CNNM
MKKAVKRNLTQRLRHSVGISDSSSDSSDEEEKPSKRNIKNWRKKVRDIEEGPEDENGEATINEKPSNRRSRGKKTKVARIDSADDKTFVEKEGMRSRRGSFQLARAAAGMASISGLEQTMPADAVLGKEGVADVLLLSSVLFPDTPADPYPSSYKVMILPFIL